MMEVINNFNINGEIVKFDNIKNGLVNKTYLVETSTNKYILQKINNFVFKNPITVMNNIELITAELKMKNLKTLNIVYTKDCKNIYYDVKNASFYRMYDYLASLENIDDKNCKTSLEVGKAIGEFQNILSICDTDSLKETISDFHNAPKRLEKLKKVYNILKDDDERKQKVTSLYDYILKNQEKVNLIQEKIDKGIIPIRIAHNDTKLNNVMFDKTSKKAVALIDLDTVMPGSILFDFGDAIRTTASNCSEDETNIDLVGFDDKLFTSLSVGYLSKMYYILTNDEVSNMINAIEVIIIECAIRFLTDYLERDVYFKIDYPSHNYVRAINQIKLFECCIEKETKWTKIIKKILDKLN